MRTNPLTSYLETYRLRTGFTRSELGFLLGALDGKSVTRHERGHRTPVLRTALAYSHVLQVSVEILYEGLAVEALDGVRVRARALRLTLRKRPVTKQNVAKIRILSRLLAEEERLDAK